MANSIMNFPLAGSVDLAGKPFTLDETSLRRCQNVIPDKVGYPTRRGVMGPVTPLARSINPGAVSNASIHKNDAYQNVLARPIWLSTPPFPGGFFTFATCYQGSRLDLCIGDGDDYGKNALAVNLLESTPYLLPTTTSYNDEQLICYGPNPQNVAGISIKREGGSPVVEDFAFDGEGNANLTPSLVTRYKGRYVYARFGKDAENASKMIFSDIDEPRVIGDNAGTDRSEIVGDTSEKLIAIREVLNNNGGTPAQSTLLVLKEFSAHMYVGEPNETDDTNDPRGTLERNKLSSSAGCISHATLCDTPFGLIWAGPDDVWLLPFGAIPIPIGRKIQPALKRQPIQTRWRCHAAYANGFYRLALYEEGQGGALDLPLGEQWWLDCRNGPPQDWTSARWYGPQQFRPAIGSNNTIEDRTTEHLDTGTCFMAVDKRAGSGKLYGAQLGTWTVNTTSQQMPTLVEYDRPGTNDIATMYRPGLIPWQASSSYPIGAEVVVWPDIFVPTISVEATIFKATVAGVSGSSEPAWPTASPTINDGSVTWTRVGRCANNISIHGSEALTKVTTREYDFGTRMVEKLMLGGEAAALLSVPEAMTLTQLVDGGRISDEITESVDATVSPNLGSALLDSSMSLLAEGVQPKAFWSAEDTRVNGRSVQYSIEEVPGITLPEDQTTFEVVIGSTTFTVDLGQRYFATVMALLTAVIAAMNADTALVDAHGGEVWAINWFRGLAFVDGTANWAYGDGTESSRNIWSLLGFTGFDAVGGELVSSTIVPNYLIGDICYVEVNGHIRPFKRRPL